MTNIEIIEASYEVDVAFSGPYEKSWQYWYQSAFANWPSSSQSDQLGLWVRYYLYYLGPAFLSVFMLAAFVKFESGVWFPEVVDLGSSWATVLMIQVLIIFIAIWIVGNVLELDPKTNENQYFQAAFAKEVGKVWKLRLSKDGFYQRSENASHWLSWKADFCFATVWENYLLIIHQDGVAVVPESKLNCDANKVIELIGKWHRDAKIGINNE